MILLKRISNLTINIFGSWKLVLILFFSIFSASAVGIYNTMDAPQLYTGETLIRFGSLDLSLIDEPHNYTSPDVYYRNKQIFGLRGYLLSVLSIPIHLMSRLFLSIVNVDNFPIEITAVKGFRLELIITTFLAIYAAIGLALWYFITNLITKNKLTSWLTILIIGLGSYVWKYSSAYIRQNMIILLLGLAAWCLIMTLRTKNYGWISGLLVIWSISFGIDIILFIALSISFTVLILSQRINISKKKYIPKNNAILIILPLTILILNIFFNFRNYGSLWASQTNQQPIVKELTGNQSAKVWLSTPFFPTITTVLFNFGKIDPNAFRNFDNLPKGVAVFASVDYAQKYNFFGIFTITPLLLFSIIGLFSKKINKIIKTFLITIFILGIVGNLKVLNFWAGNQYDVRYFYPYIVVLTPLVAEGILMIYKLKKWWWRCFGLITVGLASVWSLIMGWIGELNMYLPALSGERKIWNDILSFNQILDNGPSRLLSLTFMNRDNWWWATLTLAIVLFSVSLAISSWHKLKPWGGRRR